jgi:hypothetical protein
VGVEVDEVARLLPFPLFPLSGLAGVLVLLLLLFGWACVLVREVLLTADCGRDGRDNCLSSSASASLTPGIGRRSGTFPHLLIACDEVGMWWGMVNVCRRTLGMKKGCG